MLGVNRPRRRRAALALVVGACAACGGPAPDGEAPPSVVLILVDTLRADVLGCYGGDARVSPNIDALAARGVLFEQMQAAAPWTGPSVASVLTGRYPDEVGIHDLIDPLPDPVPTLAQRFQAAGFRTGAVISNNIAGPSFGYGKGYDELVFERYKTREGPNAGRPGFTADRVTDEALGVLAKISSSDRPFFLYVHYTDPHEPYLPPEPYRSRFTEGLEPVPDRYVLQSGYTRRMPQPGRLAALRAHYAAEVAFADAEIGRLLARVPEDALVVLTSDHGEEFAEHGRFQHGHSLYQELVHVPLILAGPGLTAGDRPGGVVSHVDIAPTVLELAGVDATIESDSFGFTGVSRVPRIEAAGELRGGTARGSPEVFSVLEQGGRRVYAARYRESSPLKLIRDDVSGKLELFDLERDPLERDDLSTALTREQPGRGVLFGELERVLAGRRAALPVFEEVLDPEAAAARDAELRAIGYK